MIIWKYFQFFGNLTFKIWFVYICVCLCTLEYASSFAHNSGNRVSDYLALSYRHLLTNLHWCWKPNQDPLLGAASALNHWGSSSEQFNFGDYLENKLFNQKLLKHRGIMPVCEQWVLKQRVGWKTWYQGRGTVHMLKGKLQGTVIYSLINIMGNVKLKSLEKMRGEFNTGIIWS